MMLLSKLSWKMAVPQLYSPKFIKPCFLFVLVPTRYSFCGSLGPARHCSGFFANR